MLLNYLLSVPKTQINIGCMKFNSEQNSYRCVILYVPICDGHTVMWGCEWYHPTIRIGLCNLRLNSYYQTQHKTSL